MTQTWDFDEYDWIDHYDDRMGGIPRLCYWEVMRRLPECAGAVAGERVLDIGTGTGNSAVPFLECGCSVVGVDPSERILQYAAAKAAQWPGRFTVTCVEDPFLALPFEAATFDLVVAVYALHHLDDDAKRRAISEMKRVLQPGGRIVIADTMFRDRAHQLAALEEYADLEEEYHPFLTTLPAIFEAEGLSVSLGQIGDLVWILTARLLTADQAEDAASVICRP